MDKLKKHDDERIAFNRDFVHMLVNTRALLDGGSMFLKEIPESEASDLVAQFLNGAARDLARSIAAMEIYNLPDYFHLLTVDKSSRLVATTSDDFKAIIGSLLNVSSKITFADASKDWQGDLALQKGVLEGVMICYCASLSDNSDVLNSIECRYSWTGADLELTFTALNGETSLFLDKDSIYMSALVKNLELLKKLNIDINFEPPLKVSLPRVVK